MTSVLHVIDDSCHETHFQALESLRSHLESPAVPHLVVAISPSVSRRARAHIKAPIHCTNRLFPSRFVNYAPALKRLDAAHKFDLVHAWGVEAATVASVMLPAVPLVLTLLDPLDADNAARWFRSLPRAVTLAAAGDVIASRLMTAGVDPARLATIHGAVDFGAINRARRENLRAQLVGEAKPVVLLSGPPARGGGEESAIWACAIVQLLHPGLKVLMPYDSRESRRLQRWVQTMPMRSMLIVPDASLGWSELVACADVFLQPAGEDVSIAPLAAAMAGGVPIVATAIRSTTEMLADRFNALLVKDADPKRVAGRLLTAIEDQALRRSITETARGQAFEVFSARTCADNYRALYENAISGRDAGEGIRDTSLVA